MGNFFMRVSWWNLGDSTSECEAQAKSNQTPLLRKIIRRRCEWVFACDMKVRHRVISQRKMWKTVSCATRVIISVLCLKLLILLPVCLTHFFGVTGRRWWSVEVMTNFCHWLLRQTPPWTHTRKWWRQPAGTVAFSAASRSSCRCVLGYRFFVCRLHIYYVSSVLQYLPHTTWSSLLH